MVRDNKARRHGHLTVLAIANLVAVLVDTMRNAGVENGVVHKFLDGLDDLNRITLTGMPLHVLEDVVEVVRGSVPVND